jgi:formylglycine-generating enzyme required for sulfatase activity
MPRSSKPPQEKASPSGVTEYLDFVLLIERVVRNHRARVLTAPEGEAEVEFRWPPPRRNLKVVEDPKDTGSLLFETIFRGAVKGRLTASLAAAKAVGKGLRLRLRLTDPALVAQPWELLYDKERGLFLALDPATPVVRYLEVAEQAVPLKLPSPIRIVVLAACPAGFATLDAKQEQNDLRKVLFKQIASSNVVVDVVPLPTVSGLQDHLQGCHVLHFIGHGDFDQDIGALLFEDDAGRPRRVDASEMADLIAAHPSVRLVVLNSCHGGRASDVDVFGGVAQSLLRRGVPAVVAMREEVEDDVAVLFSRVFYRALAEGDPVEAAITRARQAIRHAGHGFAWSLPVLYLRAPDGEIGIGSRERDRRARLLSWIGRVTSRIKPPSRVSWIKIAAALVGLALVVVIARAVVVALDHCPPPAGINMRFSYIPAESFSMGSNDKGDGPIHSVTLTKAFCLGRSEVTEAQWSAASKQPAPGKSRGGDYPVANVSWFDAKEFVAKLNDKEPTGRFRLPTEAEWEYAARGGGERDYTFGGDPEKLSDYGNCHGQRGRDRFDNSAPVGSFKATHWSLYDMYGNVSEWVEDVSPYDKGSVIDPIGSAGPDGQRMLRGGSFRTKVANCRATHRNPANPAYKGVDTGFRIVRSPVR